MSEFGIFHLVYLITISVISVLFIGHSVMNRQKITIRDVTFNDYFRTWCEHHDVKTPIEEIKGPLPPYLKSFFVVGKLYARTGITANKVSLLGLIWAFWTLECWFLGGGWILLSFVFILFSGTTDSIDGVVAYLTDTESKLGAYYDAVLDKFGDILWVAGPIYYILTNPIIQSTYNNFWITTFVLVGIFTVLLALIQEFSRARQEGLGLEETKAVIGERITRFLCLLLINGIIGFSNFFTILIPNPGFIAVNIWIITYIIPILFFSLLGLAIISIIQLTRHAQKQWK
ncbi:MAG: CDP-alcohol phosphatidyltransferase family protein [Promethearchaeota archaeon]